MLRKQKECFAKIGWLSSLFWFVLYVILANHNKLLLVTIECVGWRHHTSLIFLILLFTKPNKEVSGWLHQTKTHIIHIVYQHF